MQGIGDLPSMYQRPLVVLSPAYSHVCGACTVYVMALATSRLALFLPSPAPASHPHRFLPDLLATES